MKSCRIMAMRILLLCALAAMASHVALARSATLSLDFPLTPQEHATRLRSLAGPGVALRLHSSRPGVASRITMPFYQRSYQRQWSEGSRDSRITSGSPLTAEGIGDQGRTRFAAEHGLTMLLESDIRVRGIRQGPGSVYWDPRSGRVVVLEAKGGGSPLKRSFNSWQGTNPNTLWSAQYALEDYRRSGNLPMKVQMARVILAAEKGQLDTRVIRTRHVLGEPNAPGLTGFDSTQVVREARRARLEMIREYPETREYFREAARDHLWDRKAFRADRQSLGLEQRTARGMPVIGIAYPMELAWSMFDDPILKGGALPYMHTGLALGRAAQAVVFASRMTTTEPSSISNRSAKITGIRVAGRAALPISVGVESLELLTAYHEYDLGFISQREFYRRSAGAAIIGVFTVGGAAIGVIVGYGAGGMRGVMPGVKAGAKAGAWAGEVAATSPTAQLATDHLLSWYYRDFDEQQLRTVNAAVEMFYGLETHNEVVQD